ncbi:ankyrin repeat-containing domain protein [Aspergillus insuetus]
MALQNLPPEILLIIIEHVDRERDLNSLAQTNHYFHRIINPYLYTHKAQHSSSSALIWAVRTSNNPTTRLALAHGANPSTKDPETGKTPLTTAARAGNSELVQLLLDNPDAIDTGFMDSGFAVPFANALSAGHMHIARMLVATGRVDVNMRIGTHAQSILCFVAGRGNEGIVRMLLDLRAEGAGVDLNLGDSEGMTPLACAAAEGREGVVRILLEMEGVNIEARDKKGMTPFAWAAGNGHEGVVRMLMEAGKVDVAAGDESGVTPLGRAVIHGANGVVKLLEARGVDLGHESQSRTPLYWAIRLAASKQKARVLAGHHIHAPDPYPPRYLYSFDVPEGLDLHMLQDQMRKDWSSYKIEKSDNVMSLSNEIIGKPFPALQDDGKLRI